MTSELGNVSPTIVVPGPWSEADIRFQAAHIATQKMHNGGFNCIATQVLILPASWDRGAALVGAVEDILKATPARLPYYLGAGDREQAMLAAHPDADLIDAAGPDSIPRAVNTGIDSSAGDEICFRTEAFSAVLAGAPPPREDAGGYPHHAAGVATKPRLGTLGAPNPIPPP